MDHWKVVFFNEPLMEKLDRNECIVELHEMYTSRLWEMSDGELEEEYTKYLLGKPPYYTLPTIND